MGDNFPKNIRRILHDIRACIQIFRREREFEEEAFVGSLNEIENKNLLQHSHVKKGPSLALTKFPLHLYISEATHCIRIEKDMGGCFLWPGYFLSLVFIGLLLLCSNGIIWCTI